MKSKAILNINLITVKELNIEQELNTELIVIEILYKGACIGCRNIKINDKLPALEFHHRNPKKKEFKWENLSKLPINKIITILKNEDCVCLCKNCHSLIHSVNFDQLCNEIFGKENTSMIDLVEENYLILKKNIFNFSFKKIYKIKK